MSGGSRWQGWCLECKREGVVDHGDKDDVWSVRENEWWITVTDIPYRTVSELSQLIVQISLQRGNFDSKFQVEGVASHQSFLHR